ncbi:HNH endonuclease signature motif containing protein [Microbacterium sp. XT11]|uniref:HNH endonuclease signature motif containing protein n=1 Tax=Microbacterium sp. XT11 TaxID=367477 RepID=UPI000742D4C2|nr:HNH endonuclease signature motif containing protein [Microbacterium sp. XT11]ALX67347.1 hypothetical protein AB663_003248 [Microbacterium sp. XT11]
MDALLDATDSQMARLADLIAGVEAAEATISAMMAARDGLLALLERVAVEIAAQGDHPDRGDMTIRAVAAELGQRLRVSDRTVERRMGQASCLVDAFPAVWQAQGAGRISFAHARVIVEAGAHLEDASERAAYADAVIPLAEAESPNRLRALAKRIAETFRDRSVDERHRDARRSRRVWMTDGDDAMAGLHLHAPAVLVHAMFDRLSQMAHSLRAENQRARRPGAETSEGMRDSDTRSADELRADLLSELVLTGVPSAHETPDSLLSGIRGRVEVSVPVLTLIEREHDALTPKTSAVHASQTREHRVGRRMPPAMLDGGVPIDTATARVLAGSVSGWDRVLTHPITAAVLAVDRYRPPKSLRRHLRARDQRCRFPTCGLPARKSDLDHTEAAAAGGATSEQNLGVLCRRHHMLKHHSPWHVTRRLDGTFEWTSPLGRTYVDRPPTPHTVVFEPADAQIPAAEKLLASARAPF